MSGKYQSLKDEHERAAQGEAKPQAAAEHQPELTWQEKLDAQFAERAEEMQKKFIIGTMSNDEMQKGLRRLGYEKDHEYNRLGQLEDLKKSQPDREAQLEKSEEAELTDAKAAKDAHRNAGVASPARSTPHQNDHEHERD